MWLARSCCSHSKTESPPGQITRHPAIDAAADDRGVKRRPGKRGCAAAVMEPDSANPTLAFKGQQAPPSGQRTCRTVPPDHAPAGAPRPGHAAAAGAGREKGREDLRLQPRAMPGPLSATLMQRRAPRVSRPQLQAWRGPASAGLQGRLREVDQHLLQLGGHRCAARGWPAPRTSTFAADRMPGRCDQTHAPAAWAPGADRPARARAAG